MINHLKTLNLDFKGINVTPVILAKVVLGQKSAIAGAVSRSRKILFLWRGLKEYIYIKLGIAATTDVLFITSNHYEVEEKAIVYDKFVTPFINYLDKRKKRYKIARYTNTFTVPYNYFARKELINLQEAGVLALKIEKTNSNESLADNVTAEDFVQRLSEIGLSKDVNVMDSVYLIRFVSLKKFFKKYLQQSKVKHVVIVCFYDLKSFAMVRAANELGLPVIDLQHGVQGTGHFAYNYWPKGIVESSKLFPTHFWCWDEWSAQGIKSWFPKKENVITGSNIWMKERIRNEDKTLILFSAQPVENAIPMQIINAVKNYKGKLRWSVRLHPHQLNEMSKYKRLLQDNNILHLVEFEKATSLPLSEVLNKTSVHITLYSSVVLEAMWYGIPSIVISKLGTEYYREQVPGSMLFSAYQEDEILRSVEKLEKEWVFAQSAADNEKNFDQLANRFFKYNGQ